MICKSIEEHFANSILTALRNSKDKHQWINSNGQIFNDGPTMLFILMGICNPTVRVGVESLKKKIEAARLPAFNHDVSRCMDYMVTNYNLIIEQEETHDNIIRDVFNALLSTTNSQFYNYFSMQKLAWSNQNTKFAVDELTSEAKNICTNMVTNGEWNKVDPKDAKILALTTKIEKLENKKNPDKTKKGDKKRGNNELDPRRTKCKGPSIVINGETLWWCEHHKNPSRFPHGSHMPHKPEDHDAWKKAKEEKEAKRRKGKSEKPSQQLKLKDTLKSVLMTNYAFSEEMADSICDDTKKKMDGKDFQKAQDLSHGL